MNKLMIILAILEATVLNNPVHAASHQNIYWKLGEAQKNIQAIKNILNQNFPLPPRYESNVVVIEKVEPTVVPTEPAVNNVTTSTFPGGYALFAGGQNAQESCAQVDIFKIDAAEKIIRVNRSGEEIGPTDKSGLTLSVARHSLASAVLGDYIIFAGGYWKESDIHQGPKNTVDIFKYDREKDEFIQVDNEGKELKNNTSSGLELSESRYQLAATTIEDYAIFAGGYSGEKYHDTVDIFHLNKESGTITQVTHSLKLRAARTELTAITIRGYALFAGGTSKDDSIHTCTAIDIFKISASNASIIKVNSVGTSNDAYQLELSKARNALSSAILGEYALFGGGSGSSDDIEIKYYDGSNFQGRGAVDISDRKTGLVYSSATNLGGYHAIFAGGRSTENPPNYYSDVTIIELNTQTSSDGIYKIPDSYKSTTQVNDITLKKPVANLAATSIRDYAIFAGGYGDQGYSGVVNVFRLQKETGNDGNEKVIANITDECELVLSVARSNLAAASIAIDYSIQNDTGDGDSKEEGNNTGGENPSEKLHFDKIQRIPFQGLIPDFYITSEIVLDENDEQLAERQLREWGKISHITAGEDEIVVWYFNDFPEIPLKVKITVWHP